MNYEYEPRLSEEIEFTAEVPVTDKSYRVLENVSKIVEVKTISDVTHLPAFVSKWSIEHASQGELILAVNPGSSIGEKITSPLLEMASGKITETDWAEEYFNALMRQEQRGRGVVPLDARSAGLLLDAEAKTGITSFNLHFNHGLSFLDHILDRLHNGWFLSAYDKKSTKNTILEMPNVGLEISNNEKIYALRRVSHWKNVRLPIVA